jgi:hypothetical protein
MQLTNKQAARVIKLLGDDLRVQDDSFGDLEMYTEEVDGVVYLKFLKSGGDYHNDLDWLHMVVAKDDAVYEILDRALDNYEMLERGVKITLSYNTSMTAWKDYTGWRNPTDHFEEYIYDEITDQHCLSSCWHDSGAPYLAVIQDVEEDEIEWTPGKPSWKNVSNMYNQRFTNHPDITASEVYNQAEIVYPSYA